MRRLATITLPIVMAAGLVACDGAGTVAPETTAPTTTPAPAPVEPSPTRRVTPSPPAATSRAMAPDRAIVFARGRLLEIEVPTGTSVGGLDAPGSAGLG